MLRRLSIPIIVLVLSLGAVFTWNAAQTRLASAPVMKEELQLQVAVSKQEQRPRYRHSVVAGGVLSTGEARAAIEIDPVVARHYADIDVERLRPVRQVRARLAHVSYRKNGQIYWTRYRVRIAEGETVLAGSGEGIRARCGNRISDEAQQPTLPPSSEPSESTLNQVEPEGEPDPAVVRRSGTSPMRSPSNPIPSDYIAEMKRPTVAASYQSAPPLFRPVASGGLGMVPATGAGGDEFPGSSIGEIIGQPEGSVFPDLPMTATVPAPIDGEISAMVTSIEPPAALISVESSKGPTAPGSTTPSIVASLVPAPGGPSSSIENGSNPEPPGLVPPPSLIFLPPPPEGEASTEPSDPPTTPPEVPEPATIITVAGAIAALFLRKRLAQL
jgi:hypothetical protein